MKTWAQLSPEERAVWESRLTGWQGHSVNGVPGWYERERRKEIERPHWAPRVIRYDGVSVADEPPEKITLDDLRDVIDLTRL